MASTVLPALAPIASLPPAPPSGAAAVTEQLRLSWSAVHLTLYTALVSFAVLNAPGLDFAARLAALALLCGVTLGGVTLLTTCGTSRGFRLYRAVWFALPTAVAAAGLWVLTMRAAGG